MFKKILTMLLTLMPSMAFAASNMFDPAPGDKSLVILRAIFGSLGTFGTGADPFGEGIKMFNGCALIVGGLLVAYTIIVGTVGTSHEGEMLGKKFSSVWVPVRTALGTALVLPVINGTYCVMQVIVGWLIVQGVGLADKVWEAYTNDTTMAFASSKGMGSTSARNLGYNLFKSLSCIQTIDKVMQDIKDTNPSAMGVSVIEQKGTISKSQFMPNRMVFGATPEANGIGPTSCGNVDFPTVSLVKPTTGIGNIGPGSGIGNIADIMDFDKIMEANVAITKANHQATDQLIKDLNVVAKDMITSGKPIDISKIDEKINKYEETVNKVAAESISKLSDFKELGKNASKDGWYMAGAFYVKLAWYADTVHRASTNVGTANPGDLAIFNSPYLQEQAKTYINLIAQSTNTKNGSAIAGFGINKETGVENAEGADTLFAKVFKWNPLVLDEGEHPLMGLKRIGNWLLGIYAGVVTASVLLAGAGAGWGTKVAVQVFSFGTFDPESALNTAISFIQPLITPMLVVGLILSYVLPMLPFFLWFGATLGWLVMCIEAIIAAPMWAIMHVTASGDEMLGSGAQGYKLVLSLILRPVLMIFGLVASFVIIEVVGDILTEIFFGVFVVGQSDGNIILKVIGYLIIAPLMYAWAMFVLIKKAFSMIHVIPEEILKWFGGAQSSQLGDFANTVGGEGNGAMGGAALMASRASGMSERLIGDKVSKSKEDANKNKEADKKFANLSGGGSLASAKDDNGNAITKKHLDKKQAINNKVESAIGQLGGEGTIGASAFQERLRENMDKQIPAEMAISDALQHGKDTQYGEGASEFIQNMGNPEKGGMAGGSVQAQSLLGNKYKKLEKAGLSHGQIRDKLEGMMSSATSRFNSGELNSKGGRASLSELMANESDKVNKEMVLGSGYNSGSTPSKDDVKDDFVPPESEAKKATDNPGLYNMGNQDASQTPKEDGDNPI